MKRRDLTLNPLCPDADKYDKPYQAYQMHLRNVMAIGMLMLGFVMTGTLLSMNFNGNEYTGHQLRVFTGSAGMVAIVSTLATLIAFLISIRAGHIYDTLSAFNALLFLYRAAILLLVCEMIVYMSVVLLLHSTALYMGMMFRGPDICPGLPIMASGTHLKRMDDFLRQQMSINDGPRKSSMCAKLSEDLLEATATRCGGVQGLSRCNPPSASCDAAASEWSKRSASDPNFLMCSVMDWYHASISSVFGGNKTTQHASRPCYFGYHAYFLPTGFTSQSQTFHHDTGLYQKLILDTADAFCGKSEAQNAKNVACSSMRTVAERSLCAKTRIAWHSAEECEQETVNDAFKCHNICRPQGFQSNYGVFKGIEVASWSFVILAVFRLYKNCTHVCMARNNANMMNVGEHPILECLSCSHRTRTEEHDSDEESNDGNTDSFRQLMSA